MRTPAAAEPTLRAADRLLRRALLRSTAWLSVVLLAQLVGAAAGLGVPYTLSAAIDAVLAGHPGATALTLLAGVIAVRTVAGLLASVGGTRVSTTASVWLRRGLLAHLLAVGTAGRHRTGEVTSSLIGDTNLVAAAGPYLVNTVAGLCTSAGAIVALGLVDWRLAAAFGTALPLLWLILRRLVGRSSALFLHYSTVLAQIADRLGGALSGIRTIRASGTLDHETQRVLAPLPDLASVGYRLWQTQRHAVFRLGLLTPLVMVTMLAIAGFGVAAGRISPGEFVAVGGYTKIALGLLDHVDELVALARARAGAGRVAALLDQEAPTPGRADLPDGAGELVLRGVTVRDGDETVLDRVSLRVPPGTALALVGTAASGISTVAMVAGGLVTPDAGEVLLDGVAPADLAPAARTRAVAYAFARPALLGETVADTIAFGAPRATRAQVQGAARAAQADAFVRRLPSGYDTPLAETPLSGGEAQRLGLARAIARDARLTVLDDATASLDVATETLVTAAITTRLAGRTRVIVTHRAATAARADLVAWLDGGRVRAVAPHDELWEIPNYRAVFGEHAAGGALCTAGGAR